MNKKHISTSLTYRQAVQTQKHIAGKVNKDQVRQIRGVQTSLFGLGLEMVVAGWLAGWLDGGGGAKISHIETKKCLHKQSLRF